MTTLKGPATLTFEDGRCFQIDVAIEFPEGRGSVCAAQMMLIAGRNRSARLDCGHMTVEAIVKDGHPSGSGIIVTCGDPVFH